MADWEESIANVFITSLFAWMVYKLVTVVRDFHDDNLRIQRAEPSCAVSEEENHEDVRDGGANAGTTSQYNGVTGEVASQTDTTHESLGVVEESRPEASQSSFLAQRVEIRDSMLSGLHGMTALQAPIPAQAHHANASIGPTEPDNHIPDHNRLQTSDNDSSHTNTATTTTSAPPVSAMKEGEPLHDPIADPVHPPSLEGDNEEDDWEGIETSEAEMAFHNAASFVASATIARTLRFPPQVLLRLYGLYKQATYGVCDAPQPSMFSYSTRAKWDAWKAVGIMSSEEAMSHYVITVTECRDKWGPHEAEAEASSRLGVGGGAASGPVFSTFLEPQGGAGSDDENLPVLQSAASHGKGGEVEEMLRAGADVNALDETGRTSLHWAADRGHVSIVEMLVVGGAAVDIKDSEGQTALSYAATCEHEEVARKLLAAGADPSVLDKEGSTPYDLRPKTWTWFPSKIGMQE